MCFIIFRMTFTKDRTWIKRLKFFYFFFLFLSHMSSAFFTLVLLARLFSTSFILTSKFIFASLLSSGVVINLSWLGILPSFFNFCIIIFYLCNFCIKSSSSTKPVILGILFWISVIFVLKSVLLYLHINIFFTQDFVSQNHIVLETNSLLLGTLMSIALAFVTNWSYTVFLTTSLCTTLPSLLKSVQTGFSLSTSI